MVLRRTWIVYVIPLAVGACGSHGSQGSGGLDGGRDGAKRDVLGVSDVWSGGQDGGADRSSPDIALTGDASQDLYVSLDPGVCMSEGSSCLTNTCCTGLLCVHQSALAATCGIPCTLGSDCATGCCFDKAETGQAVCSSSDLCVNPCTKQGGSCTSADQCCSDLCVTSTASDQAGCRQLCTNSSQCSTGCCKVNTGDSYGFCTQARWCACGAAGTKCGSNDPACCAGTDCVAVGGGSNYLCRPTCKTKADCATGTCTSRLQGKDYGVCY